MIDVRRDSRANAMYRECAEIIRSGREPFLPDLISKHKLKAVEAEQVLKYWHWKGLYEFQPGMIFGGKFLTIKPCKNLKK